MPIKMHKKLFYALFLSTVSLFSQPIDLHPIRDNSNFTAIVQGILNDGKVPSDLGYSNPGTSVTELLFSGTEDYTFNAKLAIGSHINTISNPVGATINIDCSDFLLFNNIVDVTAIESIFNNGIIQGTPNLKIDQITFDGSAGTIYKTSPIDLVSDIDIVIEQDVVVEARSGAYSSYDACVFSARECDNINFFGTGTGGTIHMLIDEYEEGEWRHCISLCGCSNVTIDNLSLEESGGDGIYLGTTGGGNCSAATWCDCEHIVITNVICDGNARQGITVISANDVFINNCLLKNTGTLNEADGDNGPVIAGPYAGINMEPNFPCERIQNIAISDCVFENNHGINHDTNSENYLDQGFGLVFAFGPSTSATPAISITVDNCDISDSPRGMMFATNSPSLNGSIEITNCSIKNSEQFGILFWNWPYSDGNLDISIDQVKIDNPTQNSDNGAVTIRNWSDNYEDGGITIRNLEVTNCLSNKTVHFDRPGSNTNRYRSIDIAYTTDNPDDQIVYPYHLNNVTLARSFSSSGFSGFNRIFNGYLDDVGGTDSTSCLTHSSAKVYPGDYNGDGKTDLFVKGYGTYRALYLANASGTGFTKAFMGNADGVGGTDSDAFLTDADAIVYPGDYNGDGKTDLFVKGYGTYRALYFANSSGTGFTKDFGTSEDEAGGTDSEVFFTDPSAIIYPGDYNGDGKTDLFVKGYGTYRALYLARSSGNTFMRIFLGNADDAGGTDSDAFLTDADAIVYPGDYNGDGRTDLFIKGYETYRALYLANTSGTGFTKAFASSEDEVGGTDSDAFLTDANAIVYPGDYNGDGRTDLFVKGYETYRALYLANASGTGFTKMFGAAEDNVGGTDSDAFLTDADAIVYPGDYNGDGRTDLFVKGCGTYRALYFANSSGTGFTKEFGSAEDEAGGTDSEVFFTDPSAIVYLGDYNGDGKTDIFSKGYGSYRLLYLADGLLSTNYRPYAERTTNTSNCYLLEANYPNPFNRNTLIKFDVIKKCHVTLSVFNCRGQKISTLVDEVYLPGKHEARFDGKDLASGIYVYQFTAGEHVENRQMLYIK